MEYKKHLDNLIKFATSERFLKELETAKFEYFKEIGELYTEDQSYETRMRMFNYWFVFDRMLVKEKQIPVEIYFNENKQDHDILSCFKSTIHSLFIIEKIKKEKVFVKNIILDEKNEVVERRSLSSFHKDDIFEGRLIPIGDELYFTDALLFHPKEIKKILLAKIKKQKETPNFSQFDFIQKLSYTRLKMDRYKHVDVMKLYEM